VRHFESDRDVKVYSASVEYEVSPLSDFGLVLGYGHHWFDKDEGDNDDDNSFLVGAFYDLLEDTRLKGSVARKIRFPSIRQLYDEDGGNPDLTREKSYNYELGVERALPGNSVVNLTGFIIDVEDYIEKIPPSNTFQNNDEYRFEGFELTAETHFVENLMLRAGYTYMETEDRSSGTEKDELQYRPRNKVTFEARYSFDCGFSPYVNVMHVADQCYYSRKSPLIKRELDDYTLVNVKLEQVLLASRLRLYLGADNLFDEDYEESYAFPQAGRTIYGGIDIYFR
jgi:outer membrane cobalamin receptor